LPEDPFVHDSAWAFAQGHREARVDEKQGLANGQPNVEVDDSLTFCLKASTGEHEIGASRA
jgi:hypothetical protein